MKPPLAVVLIALAGCIPLVACARPMGGAGEHVGPTVSTHLMFQGAADDAIQLYRDVFPDFIVEEVELHGEGELAGKVRMARVNFAQHSLIIFDSPPVHPFTFTPAMSLFVELDDADELTEAFEILSTDGEVMMPLADYGFGPLFGWLQDRYGVSWQLSLTPNE